MWGYEKNIIARVLATSLFSVAIMVSFNGSPAHALRAGSWSWPLSGTHTISRGYEAPNVFYGAGHRGIDLFAEVGQEVVAPADGVVHFVGTVVDRDLISLDHDGMLSTFEPVTSSRTIGEMVKRGDVIGTVGISTHCACVHMGARVGKEYLSPLAMLASVTPAVLLPWD